jgi:diketogulonate reductase-like aldo/keto reductase
MLCAYGSCLFFTRWRCCCCCCRFHAKTGYDAGIRAWCSQQGIAYQSFWTLTANPDCIKSGVVRAAAKKRGCEPEQVSA